MRSFILLIFLFSLFFCNGQTTFVVDDENAPNEPTIVFSQNADNLYAASNIDNFYSIDELKRKLNLNKFKATSSLGIYGDPVLHYLDTNLFFAHLAKTPGKAYGDWFDRIVVQKINSVIPWEETSYSVGFNQGKMQDKPWMSSDHHSQYSGNLYLTWTEFDVYDSPDPEDKTRIRFSSYNSNNDSFSEAITISDTTGNCEDSDNTLEGVSTTIGSEGEIYAVWAGHDKIWFDYSIDGGETWNEDKIIAQQTEGWDMDMPHIQRANGMPFICSDIDRGIIYVCWADEKASNADIWLKYSKDKGKTWSSRIKVNNELQQSNQYFPNIDIDQNTGKVYIAYYDQQYSSSQRFYDISLGILDLELSDTISTTRITNQSIPLPGPKVFYGDYLDIDVHNNSLAMVYTTNYKGKIAIQVTTGDTKDFKDYKPKIYPFTLAPDNYSIKDSTVIYINHQSAGILTLRTISGTFPNKKRNRSRVHITSEEMSRDKLLITLPNQSGYKVKIKFRKQGIEKEVFKTVLKGA